MDKQARLNQLPATVSLRRHQLAFDPTAAAGAAAEATRMTGSTRGVLPADLSDALVFDSNQLDKLKRRMQVIPSSLMVLEVMHTEA